MTVWTYWWLAYGTTFLNQLWTNRIRLVIPLWHYLYEWVSSLRLTALRTLPNWSVFVRSRGQTRAANVRLNAHVTSQNHQPSVRLK